MKKNMLPPSKIQQGLGSILEYLVICENILDEYTNKKHPEETVNIIITVKNQNCPYVQLTVIMWGILGVAGATPATACQQPGDWKRKASDKGLSDLCGDSDLCRYCIEQSQVGFTVDNFLLLRREIGLKLA